MKYFSFFSTLNYKFPDGSRPVLNVFSRPELTVVDNSGYNVKGNKYVVEDAKSPDIVSLEAYQDPEYFWSILLTNNIIDFYKEWPISYSSWQEELANTNADYTFYTVYNTEILEGDIIVKKKAGSSILFDNENYGVVIGSDRFLRSFDVKMVSGQINEQDEYYILRSGGLDYQIISPQEGSTTQLLKKKDEKLNSIAKFFKLDSTTQQKVFVSPYYSVDDGSLISDQISDLSSETGTKTVLYHYMNNDLPSDISTLSFIKQKEEDWVFRKTINIIPSRYKNNIDDAYNVAIEGTIG
jgi:hypothetical protein